MTARRKKGKDAARQETFVRADFAHAVEMHYEQKVRDYLDAHGTAFFADTATQARVVREYSHAILSNKPHRLSLLFDCLADPNVPIGDGWHPLHAAISMSKTDMVARLAPCLDINAPDDRGNTPLHKAYLAQDGVAVAHILVAHGADIRQCNEKGQTPIETALQVGRQDIAVAIREAYALRKVADIKKIMTAVPDETAKAPRLKIGG